MRLKRHSLCTALVVGSVKVAAHQTKIIVAGAATGVNVQSGAAPARININDLYEAGGPAWDLYVQALAELQAVDEEDELSYFKLMGIHGLPFLPFNGVGQVPGGAHRAGFCPHNELLFGLWHRPYVALFEQVLVSHALNISMRYSDADAPSYRTAAETLRVAFWDWAQTPALPEAISLSTVTVNSPKGSLTMRNPLHRYHFHTYPFNSTYMRHGGVFSKQNHTTRCPNADMVQNATAVNIGLGATNLKAQVYEVFTTVEDFQDMETDYYSRASFESPHNSVHNAVGCANGTMYDLNWSAFDPIFMLHHANVDRLIALWQAIYHNSSIYTTSDYEPALYGTAAGPVGGLTPLKPFYDEAGNFHTSESVRDISTFGYTYPELQPTDSDGQQASLSADQLSSYVKFRVNSLYADNSTKTAACSDEKARQSGSPSIASGKTNGAVMSKTWSVAIQVDKAQIPLPATVHCYLGSSLVGVMALLGIPATGITHSTIPLDGTLDVLLADLGDEEVVLGLLAEGLRFEVQKGDGATVDVGSIPSLEIAVVDRDITPRKSEYNFPTYGVATKHPWPLEG